jgi:hypothetical protein
MRWHEFELAAPELARLGRERFEATHVALLGTLRSDGSPRICPIEPYLALGELVIGALSSSRKARDLLRDSRCTLHSSVSDVNGSEGEFKVHGVAVLITNEAVVHGDYEAWWTAPGASAGDVFSIDIASIAHLAWNIDSSEMTVTRWDSENMEQDCCLASELRTSTTCTSRLIAADALGTRALVSDSERMHSARRNVELQTTRFDRAQRDWGWLVALEPRGRAIEQVARSLGLTAAEAGLDHLQDRLDDGGSGVVIWSCFGV